MDNSTESMGSRFNQHEDSVRSRRQVSGVDHQLLKMTRPQEKLDLAAADDSELQE